MQLLRLYIFLSLFTLFVVIDFAYDDDDDLTDGFSDIFAPSSYVDSKPVVLRDKQLKGSLELRQKWLEIDPDRIYSDSGSLVFLQLSEHYFREFSRKVKRKRWRDFLRFNHNSRKVVIGYSEGGDSEYRMHYMDELVKNPEEDVSFAQSRVFGYAYDLTDFKMRFSVISRLISSGKKIINIDGDDWDILLKDVKPRALILIALVNRKPSFIMASTKSVDADLLPWSREALKHAFMQYFVVESARDGRITSQLCRAYQNDLIDGFLHLESILGSLRRYIRQIKNPVRSSRGHLIQVEKRSATTYRYKFTEHFSESIKQFAKLVSSNTLNRYAAIVFLEDVAQQYDALRREILNIHKMTQQGWTSINDVSDLEELTTKPLIQLVNELDLLDRKVRTATEAHKKRFQASISVRGEVRFQQSLDMGFR